MEPSPDADRVGMSKDRHPEPTGSEREIPPRDIDPAGSARGVDDHVVTPYPRGIGHQDTGAIDDAAEREHLTPSWQGARIEDAPDPDREAPPPGESEG
jgi:hypothetical protein